MSTPPPIPRNPNLPEREDRPPSDGEQASDEREQQQRIPLWIAPAAVLLGVAAGFVTTVIVELVGQALGSPIGNPTPAVLIISNYLFDLCFVGAAAYFVVLRGSFGLAQLGYRRISWGLAIGGVLTAAFVYYLATVVYAALLGLHATDRLPSDLGVKNSLAAAIGVSVFVCVVAPVCEEFFFRGFLFGVLRQMRVRIAGRDLGPWIAAVIVGLLFGLAHTGSANAEFLVPLGFLGFVLCILRWRTDSLYPGMALHSINNCIALGVNELAWKAGPILALVCGALAVIALVTGPLSRPRTAQAS